MSLTGSEDHPRELDQRVVLPPSDLLTRGNDGTTMVLSVAPLSPANRPQVVEDLVAQGLNEREAGEAVVYEVMGDTEGFPAIVNVLRTESWMSVLSATGGQTAYDEAIAICDEMSQRAYSS